MQPEDQVFKTASPEFIGLFSLRMDFNASNYFLPYIDFAFKTNGWVAGYKFLKANASKAGNFIPVLESGTVPGLHGLTFP
jgi:hypothetical protein